MATSRFITFKIDCQTTKPWVVQDTAADRNEDDVLYRFTSKAKAESFRQMMEAERKAA